MISPQSVTTQERVFGIALAVIRNFGVVGGISKLVQAAGNVAGSALGAGGAAAAAGAGSGRAAADGGTDLGEGTATKAPVSNDHAGV